MEDEADKTKIEEKPKAGKGDVAHLAARVVLSSIPGVGGAAKEIFNAIVAPPLAKRQAKWIESVVDKLRELEGRVEGFKIENLPENETFITIITYATTIALRNHQEEKLEALRNAVLNTAVSPSLEEDLRHMFINFVDELTPWHLRLLKYFNNPELWLTQNNIPIPNFYAGGSSAVMHVAFPELETNFAFAGQLIRDLRSRGLSSTDLNSMNTMKTRSGMFSPLATPLGRQFLAYIASPIQTTV